MILRGSNALERVTAYVLLLFCLQTYGYLVKDGMGVTKDQMSTRANTLLDDVDDTQPQLDNEVRERLARPKTVWVIHIPTRFPALQTLDGDLSHATTPNTFLMRYRRQENLPEQHQDDQIQCGDPTCPCKEAPKTSCECPADDNWSFKDQHIWKEKYKDCGGRSQSPVDLPVDGLIRARGARKFLFANYDQQPENMTLVKDGRTVTLYGHWKREKWPMVYGGAAHSRRYLFHSLSIFWPSEHGVGGLHYPMESQVLHISAEYKNFQDAVASASSDPQAFLGIVNIFKYDSSTLPGALKLINAAIKCPTENMNFSPMPLCALNPPFKDFVCYQGSLTSPPCTESVLWLVRRRSLPITRKTADSLRNMNKDADGVPIPSNRFPQPLNDRKVYLFT